MQMQENTNLNSHKTWLGSKEENFCSRSMDFHRPVFSKVGYRHVGVEQDNCDSEKQILKKIKNIFKKIENNNEK